jgi:hypothetical protein
VVCVVVCGGLCGCVWLCVVVCVVVCGGVWCVVCGVWCVVCGVWCVVCGVWCVVWCVVVWCGSSTARRKALCFELHVTRVEAMEIVCVWCVVVGVCCEYVVVGCEVCCVHHSANDASQFTKSTSPFRSPSLLL